MLHFSSSFFEEKTMPDVKRCPHCLKEITPGDVERFARAEIESGWRKEFESAYSFEVASLGRNIKRRIRTFYSAFAVLMLLSLSLVIYSLVINRGPDQPLVMLVILAACLLVIFVITVLAMHFAPKVIDPPYNEIENKFKEFKVARGYDSGN